MGSGSRTDIAVLSPHLHKVFALGESHYNQRAAQDAVYMAAEIVLAVPCNRLA